MHSEAGLEVDSRTLPLIHDHFSNLRTCSHRARHMLTRKTMSGVYVLPPTPFDAKRRFDEERMRSNVRRLCEAGVDAVVTTGSVGEFHTIRWEDHKKLIEVAASASAVKAEADKAHAAFVEAFRGADNAHKEYIANLVKIRELRQQIATSGQLTKVRKAQEVRERLEKSGGEKLEQGKRLSLEEFKALMEKGAI